MKIWRRFDRFVGVAYLFCRMVCRRVLAYLCWTFAKAEWRWKSDIETQYALLIISCSLIATLPYCGIFLLNFRRFLRFLCAFGNCYRGKKINELSLNTIISNLKILGSRISLLMLQFARYSVIPCHWQSLWCFNVQLYWWATIRWSQRAVPNFCRADRLKATSLVKVFCRRRVSWSRPCVLYLL